MSSTVRIDGAVMDYAWGRTGGITTARGQVPGTGPEAELWLGAHPSCPSAVTSADMPWADLSAWETATGTSLPFLMKLLAAGAPLSLQAHPDPEQARAGFAREEADGVARDAPERNYRDPHAKPEVLLAVEDGFDALCGFRPLQETVDLLDRLDAGRPSAGLAHWRSLLVGAPDPAAACRDALAWLLSGEELVDELVAEVTAAAPTGMGTAEGELVQLLSTHHPGDPGILVALMLNRVRLAAGEAVWLAAGTIHAYLSGLGVEVMGPSDNVLRGGLTGKHVDTAELLRILDTTPGPPPRLAPTPVGPGVTAYRPAHRPGGDDVAFQVLRAAAPATVSTAGPSVGLALDGEVRLRGEGLDLTLLRGEACFTDGARTLTVEGDGVLYLATTSA